MGEKLKIHMPKLRNKIMLILSSKKPSELAPREGKEQLAEEIKESINDDDWRAEPAKGKKPAKTPSRKCCSLPSSSNNRHGRRFSLPGRS